MSNIEEILLNRIQQKGQPRAAGDGIADQGGELGPFCAELLALLDAASRNHRERGAR